MSTMANVDEGSNYERVEELEELEDADLVKSTNSVVSYTMNQ